MKLAQVAISVGFAGLGAFGSEFVGLFRAHPLVGRIVLCDREPDRIKRIGERPAFKRKWDPREAVASIEELARTDVDAIAIFTQPWLHAPQAIEALEGGKHVYSAVPVISVPDSDEIMEWCGKLVEACRKTGRRYMLGETTCYRPQAMYCRRRAAEGAFGEFVYGEGHYLHDVDSPGCNLRDVRRSRGTGAAGSDWTARAGEYVRRGVKDGPMHYPTHSVSGPLWAMDTRAVAVCAWGTPPPPGDDYFDDSAFSNETALFHLANGATMRIAEHRKIGHPGEEIFSVWGTNGSFRGSEGPEGNHWFDKSGSKRLADEEMRDPLPEDFRKAMAEDGLGLGGHGGSHAYLVNEFVSAIAAGRAPAVDVKWAARFMAAGAMAHKSALAGGKVLDVPFGDVL